ncbi:hypothetical protein [Limnohabitans sp.]
MTKILSKSDIIAAQDLQTQEVPVPEWGGSVRVRSLTGTERDAFETCLVKVVDGKRVPDMDNLRAKLLAATLVDENGTPLFSVADVGDLSDLGSKSAAALDRIFGVAQRLNGMAAESVEVAVKNSEPGPSDGSTSV